MFDIEYVPITCQWIYDDGTKCDKDIMSGKSFCDHHHEICYSKVKDEDEAFNIISKELEWLCNGEDLDG